ncbi:translation initiation factor IF-2 [Patescibacteria group bacterium]
MTSADQTSQKIERPTIVVVMGHVDHGKTKLLDVIRKTNVVEKESGGITQHVGAYEVVHNNKKITFIDTPGHVAFHKMRERGAKVADVAILVVAVDEGVKPQTIEALEAIRKENLPFIVALNKIDKSNADQERVKKELGEKDVVFEDWGGKVPSVAISAKGGINIDELLDTIILLGELEELKADPAAEAQGVVIESHLDPQRGNAATLLIQNGTIHKGECVVVENTISNVKILEDFTGKNIDEATFSAPVRVIGFDSLPAVGASFQSFRSKGEALKIKKGFTKSDLEVGRLNGNGASVEENIVVVPILIKADTLGSHEALEDELEKMELEGIELKFLRGGAGDVGEDDIKKVCCEKDKQAGVVFAFRVKISKEAQDVSERLGVKIYSSEIIYEAVEWLKNESRSFLPKEALEKIKGELEVLKVFRENETKRIIGGKVISGKIMNGDAFSLVRKGNKIAKGEIVNLEVGKQKAGEVLEGSECGLMVDSPKKIEKGDVVTVFENLE